MKLLNKFKNSFCSDYVPDKNGDPFLFIFWDLCLAGSKRGHVFLLLLPVWISQSFADSS